jgi:hypothetical protein
MSITEYYYFNDFMYISNHNIPYYHISVHTNIYQ